MAEATVSKKKKIRRSDYQYTVFKAMRNGDWITRLSFLIMGFGNIVRKQFVKGLSFLVLESIFIYFMIKNGASLLTDFFHLGGAEQEKVWNDAKGIFEYTQGDNSLLMLLYGVATVFIIFAFVCLWVVSVESAYRAQCLHDAGKKVPGFTNYSKLDSHTVLFNWVGLKNFAKILNFNDAVGSTFWSVLGWTLVWAVAATFTNYIFGMILAMVINRKGTRCKSVWRSIFMLSAAVPQFVSLLLMRTIFSQNGIVNTLLLNHHIIDNAIPFWSNATIARIMVIVINIWIGIPFTIMQVTGILQSIPEDIYEAAKVDGAGPVKIFFKITLPYMLFVTAPYLITTFAGNINNFNVIYLLSNGAPIPVGKTAGKTDLLVTWLYKLTVDNQYYNLGAVIGIMTFIVLAIVSLITYHNTTSYKDEEGFQ